MLVFDGPALTAVDVRGAAPGSRELACLAPGQLAQRVDAIVLTGGSAFGLAAADGVVRELATLGRGFQTAAGPVPIVPAAVIFDLSTGSLLAPDAGSGRIALRNARPANEVEQGATGAGTGATWNKLAGDPRAGGIGIAQEGCGDSLITAFVVLNALGAVRGLADDPRAGIMRARTTIPGEREATTLMAIVTDFPCDHGTLTRMCVAAHDALARLVVPAHTMFDGDIAFASTVAEAAVGPGDRLPLMVATELAVEAAILRAAQPGMLH